MTSISIATLTQSVRPYLIRSATSLGSSPKLPEHRWQLADICERQALPGAREGHIQLARVLANQLGALLGRQSHTLLGLTQRVRAHHEDDRTLQPGRGVERTHADM